MAYDLKFDSDSLIIELVFAEVLSDEELQKYTDEAILLQANHGVNAILVDAIDLESTPSTMEVYDLPRRYVEHGLRRSTCPALVWPRYEMAR